MKQILCFGDSNTHGFNPLGERFDWNTRWTGILADLLGPDYHVIEEGMNGRTSSLDDPFVPCRNAMDYIIPCLESHKPLDLVILMLGSNDMKQFFSPSLEKITASLERLSALILDVSGAPLLLVSPILLGPDMENSPFREEFPPSSLEISRALAPALHKTAEKLGVSFLNAAEFADPCSFDSLHLAREGHRSIAEAFYKKILEMEI